MLLSNFLILHKLVEEVLLELAGGLTAAILAAAALAPLAPFAPLAIVCPAPPAAALPALAAVAQPQALVQAAEERVIIVFVIAIIVIVVVVVVSIGGGVAFLATRLFRAGRRPGPLRRGLFELSL